MAFPKLAAALALTALSESDDDRAASAVAGLRERATAAELDAAQQRAEATRLSAELAVQAGIAQLAATEAMDRLIADAYTSGKLAYGRDAAGKPTPSPMESLLRDYGKAAGRDKLSAKITEMQQVVPLGVRPLAGTTEPEKTTLASVPSDEQLAATAAQLGIPVEQLRARYGKVGAR